jgi:hypothetical protein
LLVLVSGSREGGAGKLLGVEPMRGLLRGVLSNRKGTWDSLGSGKVSRGNDSYDLTAGYLLEIGTKSILIPITLGNLEDCDWHRDYSGRGSV